MQQAFAVIVVAAGSGLGGVLRYGMHTMLNKWYPSAFPVGTMSVNVLGCFAIGVFFALFEKAYMANAELKLFLITGICGGFTTFSAFSLENIALLRSGNMLYAVTYIVVSVVAGILATMGGMYLVK